MPTQIPRDEKADMLTFERHNARSLVSTDPQERLYGTCGCIICARVRARLNKLPAPINVPGRQGKNTMGSVNICDRDGSLVKGQALGRVMLRFSSEYDSETIDIEICPRCVKDVLEVIEHKPNDDESKRAHSEPFKRPEEPSELDAVQMASAEQLVAAALEKLMKRETERRAIEADKQDVTDSYER